MDNSVALQRGTQMAKDMIARHVLNTILVPMANAALDYVVQKRTHDGHNMTGNTINSYVVGAFVKGKLAYMRGSWESIPGPLTHKVYSYQPGRIRWDGEDQNYRFPTRGTAQHNGSTEPERAIAFIRSYQASPKGWTIVVANGVEYGTYEENVYGADTLTGSFTDFKMTHMLHFKPMPD